MGLITYGTHVQVHELGFAECAKSYVFRGSKVRSVDAPSAAVRVLGPAAASIAASACCAATAAMLSTPAATGPMVAAFYRTHFKFDLSTIDFCRSTQHPRWRSSWAWQAKRGAGRHPVSPAPAAQQVHLLVNSLILMLQSL